jgi:acyl-lipid omega-6 desaturase (Delta-12 desaturase)
MIAYICPFNFDMIEQQQIITDLKDWKSIIKPYATPDTKVAKKEVIKTFIPFGLVLIAAFIVYEFNVWATLPLCFLAGLYLTRVFIIQHDCGHQSFLPTRKKNSRMGFISSMFTWIPYQYWARSHNYHHSHQGQLDTRTIGDVTLLTVREYMALSSWGKFKYKLYRSVLVMFILGPIYYIFIHNRIPFIQFKGWSKERRALLATNFCLLFFFIVSGALLGLISGDLWAGYKKLVIVYIPVLMSFGFTAVWFFYMQHQHDPNYKAWKEDWQYVMAAIKGSSYYKLPAVINFFTGNIGFHHIHHLAPRVPFYKLQKCSDENPILQKHVTEITLLSSLKYAFYTLWDEDNYRMVRFKDLKKAEIKLKSDPFSPIVRQVKSSME